MTKFISTLRAAAKLLKVMTSVRDEAVLANSVEQYEFDVRNG